MTLLTAIATFWIISLTGALSPGPLMAMAISQGPRQGSWSGVQLALGHLAVEGPLALAIAYGLGTWLKTPLVGGVIGVIGGVFLLWMGYTLVVGAWRNELRLETEPQPSVETGRPGVLTAVAAMSPLTTGALLTVTNPYWSLWWATVGATQLAQVTQYGLLGILALFLIGHWSADLGWLGGLSLATASGRGLISPGLYRGILLICGVFLVIMSGVFITSGGQALLNR